MRCAFIRRPVKQGLAAEYAMLPAWLFSMNIHEGVYEDNHFCLGSLWWEAEYHFRKKCFAVYNIVY